MSSSTTNNQNNNLDIEEGGPRLSTTTAYNNVYVEQQNTPVVPPTSTDIDQSNQPRSIVGLELVDDDDTDMPLPMGMAEDISNRAEPPKQKGSKIEQLDDDDVGPEPPTAMLEASLNNADITTLEGSATDMNHSSTYAAALTEALQSGKINAKEVQNILNALEPTLVGTEYINERPPVPFNSTEFEQDAIAKKKAKDEMMNQKPAAVSNNEDEEVVLAPSDRDSIHEPSREIIEGGEGMSDNTNTGGGGTNRRGWDDIESRAARRDIESQTRTNNHEDTADSIDNDSLVVANVEAPTSANQEGLPEIEAYLVEDVEEEVFIATPTLPWWKQRRTKILLGAVLLTVSTLAIALGVLLSRPSSTTVNMIVNSTTAPSVSSAPTSSLAPSSSPTECVNKIISNKQDIDLKSHLLIDSPRDTKVAVDGRNMVVVALDGKYYNDVDEYDGPAFVTFYTLDNNDEWQRVQTPIRADGVASNLSGRVMYSVDLSGSIAFVGLPFANDGTGAVLVYEQNDFGEWERVDDPFVHSTNTTQDSFGYEVDIGENLACVAVEDDRYLLHITGVNIYHKDDSKWVQFDTIGLDISECLISGDTIAIYDKFWASIQLYKYNQDQNEVVPTQDPIPERVSSMELSNDYLVYRDYWDEVFFIYHQDKTNQTFTLQQQLNITGLPRYNSIALDNDILVVGGDNQTYIYSLQDGDWVESITLDESFDDIKVSGRTLLATKYNNTSLSSEVYSYNIQDCTQDMPTQLPSSSVRPTASPSFPPSLSLSPSSLPSVSSLPTTTFKCFELDNGGKDGVLYNAVRLYVSQDCANDEECEIGQTYGWPMNSWCVGNVKDMSYLFYEMDTFNEEINGWNTSSVTDMSFMFFNAEAFHGDISNFDTSSVTSMSAMFFGASLFNGNMSKFDTSSVTNMGGMFIGATLFNGDLSNFDTSSVDDMGQMFNGATSFNQDLSNFDTSSVTTMYAMFWYATSFNGDVSNFNTSSATDMESMFYYATSFNGDVSNFDTSSVTDMRSMFRGANVFNGDVSNFDTSKVTDMHSYVLGCHFL